MKINHIQIHDYNLNISARLNETIERLPNEWICLTDNDTLKFPNFADNIKETLLQADEKNLYGTMTNRLRPSNPQVIIELYDESDMNVHFDRSVTQWNDYKNTYIKTKVIAGSCMLFHKSLWTNVGGFDKSKIFFDKYFSYAVAENGGRCLIAKGIYVFHLYRWGAIDPVSSVNHLIKP